MILVYLPFGAVFAGRRGVIRSDEVESRSGIRLAILDTIFFGHL
jgi:hypothetical protein